MALQGSLDDVPLVDVLQFVHLSGKSGVLSLNSPAGPAWIEFSRGQIVFAHGPDTRALGVLLVEAGLVSLNDVAAAVEEQRTATERRPLGRILIERGVISQEGIAKGVRQQIQETMMEIAVWRRGEFRFEQGIVALPDSTRVEVEDVIPLVNLNTQFLLLEAARLYDERRRGRTERVESDPPPVRAVPPPVEEPAPSRPPSSRPPDHAHASAPTTRPPTDEAAADPHTPELVAVEPLTTALETDRKRLASLADGSGIVAVSLGEPWATVLGRAVARAGMRMIGRVAAGELLSRLAMRKQASQGLVLAWGVPAEPARVREVRQLVRKIGQQHPGIQHLALVASPTADVSAALYAAGVRAVLPLPDGHAEVDQAATMNGLAALLSQVRRESAQHASTHQAELRAWRDAKRVTAEMQQALDRASISLELLRVAAQTLDRAALFLVKRHELIGLGAFGLTVNGKPMAEALRGLALEVGDGTAVARALETRRPVHGPVDELGLGALFLRIAGRPVYERGLLVPLTGPSRTIGLLYADNGLVKAPLQGIHALEIAATQAGLAYENVLLRMKLGLGREGERNAALGQGS